MKERLIQNGYTKLPNEMLDSLIKLRLAPSQWKTLMFIIRKTLGWRKKSDFIPLNQFTNGVGLRKPHICRALSVLLKRNIITKTGNKTYALQEDWHLWKVITKIGNTTKITKIGNIVTKNGNRITKIGNKKISKVRIDEDSQAPKETYSKETYSKEIKMQNQPFKDSKKTNFEKFKDKALNQSDEIDNLITLYKEKFPGHIKRYGIKATMKMRDTIEGTLLEGISIKDIAERISKAKDGTPWKIISDKWVEKYKKEKERYDKVIKRFSNK